MANNLWVLLYWNTIQGHAVACIQNELLLFEEILLTYLDLGEERDDLEPAFGALWPGAVEVIYEEHFALNVEVQFLLQKSLRVLVHEVVGGVASHVTIEMLSQLVRRLDKDERCCVLRQPLCYLLLFGHRRLSGAVGHWLANWMPRTEPGEDLSMVDLERFGNEGRDLKWVRQESKWFYANYYGIASMAVA